MSGSDDDDFKVKIIAAPSGGRRVAAAAGSGSDSDSEAEGVQRLAKSANKKSIALSDDEDGSGDDSNKSGGLKINADFAKKFEDENRKAEISNSTYRVRPTRDRQCVLSAVLIAELVVFDRMQRTAN